MAFRDTAYTAQTPSGWTNGHYEKTMAPAVLLIDELLEAEVPSADCSRS